MIAHIGILGDQSKPDRVTNLSYLVEDRTSCVRIVADSNVGSIGPRFYSDTHLTHVLLGVEEAGGSSELTGHS